jgi:hypothetical protein
VDLNSLDQHLKSRLPTFSSLILPEKRPQKILISAFIISLLITFLALSAGLLVWGRGETYIPKIVTFSRITSRATAYGSQRHIFGGGQKGSTLGLGQETKVAGTKTFFAGSLVAIWLKDNQVHASFSNDYGETWQELAEPLVADSIENVAGEQDKNGNLHLAYESKGKIKFLG